MKRIFPRLLPLAIYPFLLLCYAVFRIFISADGARIYTEIFIITASIFSATYELLACEVFICRSKRRFSFSKGLFIGFFSFLSFTTIALPIVEFIVFNDAMNRQVYFREQDIIVILETIFILVGAGFGFFAYPAIVNVVKKIARPLHSRHG